MALSCHVQREKRTSTPRNITRCHFRCLNSMISRARPKPILWTRYQRGPASWTSVSQCQRPCASLRRPSGTLQSGVAQPQPRQQGSRGSELLASFKFLSCILGVAPSIAVFIAMAKLEGTTDRDSLAETQAETLPQTKFPYLERLARLGDNERR